VAAIAHVKGKDLASVGVQGNPHPPPIRLLPDKAPALIHLGFQAMQDDFLSACCRLDMEMIRSSAKACGHNMEEPAPSDSYRTTDSTQ
jgi:hypothetical protein